MSSEEKKASWAKFSESAKRKKAVANRMQRPMHSGKNHPYNPNPGGYCKECGEGRDFS